MFIRNVGSYMGSTALYPKYGNIRDTRVTLSVSLFDFVPHNTSNRGTPLSITSINQSIKQTSSQALLNATCCHATRQIKHNLMISLYSYGPRLGNGFTTRDGAQGLLIAHFADSRS
jgi:hypothetical protein